MSFEYIEILDHVHNYMVVSCISLVKYLDILNTIQRSFNAFFNTTK